MNLIKVLDVKFEDVVFIVDDVLDNKSESLVYLEMVYKDDWGLLFLYIRKFITVFISDYEQETKEQPSREKIKSVLELYVNKEIEKEYY